MTRGRRRVSYFLMMVLTAGIFMTPAAGQVKVAASSPATGAPSPTRPIQEEERIPFMAHPPNEPEAEPPSATRLLMRTLGALLLIVGLIAAAAWGLRRFGGARFGAPTEDAPELSVLATISLGDKRSLAAVRFGERLLLIGSTAHTVTLLATDDRRANQATRPARSVADLLKEGEAGTFEQTLAIAGERLNQRMTAPSADSKAL